MDRLMRKYSANVDIVLITRIRLILQILRSNVINHYNGDLNIFQFFIFFLTIIIVDKYNHFTIYYDLRYKINILFSK